MDRKRVLIFADADTVAKEASKVIAAEARAAVEARGRFVMAVSGGRTPWRMLRALAGEDVPWNGLHVVQVDERIAPAGDPDRNLTRLRKSLLEQAPLPPENIHAMPVEETDLEAAARSYANTLGEVAGIPPVLDLAHLGLGPDGHTASLIPQDPVLNVTGLDAALTGIYQERRRMTLTYPMLNRSRRILWVITGSEKAEMLVRLCDGDVSIPAGRIRQEQALVLADQLAAAGSRTAFSVITITALGIHEDSAHWVRPMRNEGVFLMLENWTFLTVRVVALRKYYFDHAEEFP